MYAIRSYYASGAFLLAVAVSLLIAAFATAGASFTAETLTFNMSPSVFGSYWTEGSTSNEQWFA